MLTSCEFGSVSKYLSSVSLEISFLSLLQSADLYLNTLWGGFLFRIGLRFTSNVTASWSLMPGVVCVLVMMEGFEVSMRSRMLPVGGIVSGPAALWGFRLDRICWIPVAEMLMSGMDE